MDRGAARKPTRKRTSKAKTIQVAKKRKAQVGSAVEDAPTAGALREDSIPSIRFFLTSRKSKYSKITERLTNGGEKPHLGSAVEDALALGAPPEGRRPPGLLALQLRTLCAGALVLASGLADRGPVLLASQIFGGDEDGERECVENAGSLPVQAVEGGQQRGFAEEDGDVSGLLEYNRVWKSICARGGPLSACLMFIIDSSLGRSKSHKVANAVARIILMTCFTDSRLTPFRTLQAFQAVEETSARS